MIVPKILVFITLITTPPAERGWIARGNTPHNCQEIEFSWSKTDTRGGLDNGSVTIQFTGDRSLFAVYLLTSKGKTKLNSSESSIKNLKKGKHSIVITGEKEGSNFCQEFFEVVIN